MSFDIEQIKSGFKGTQDQILKEFNQKHIDPQKIAKKDIEIVVLVLKNMKVKDDDLGYAQVRKLLQSQNEQVSQYLNSFTYDELNSAIIDYFSASLSKKQVTKQQEADKKQIENQSKNQENEDQNDQKHQGGGQGAGASQFENPEHQQKRKLSIQLLNSRFTKHTLKICEIIQNKKAASSAEQPYTNQFYHSLLEQVLKTCELKLASWKTDSLRDSKDNAQQSSLMDSAASFLQRTYSQDITLSHSTLLSDLSNFIQQNLEVTLMNLQQTIPDIQQSKSPIIHTPHKSTSTKTKIMSSIKNYSQLLTSADPKVSRTQIFLTLDLLRKQLNAQILKKRGTGSYSVGYNSDDLSSQKRSFHNQSHSTVLGTSSPRHAYGVTSSQVGRDSHSSFNKKTYPQSLVFSRKLKSLRKSFGSRNSMFPVQTPRGIDGALEEIFIFYSYKTMGARPGGMTAGTQWIISLTDLQKLAKDFAIPLTKFKITQIYKRICERGNGMFSHGINFDKFQKQYMAEMGKEIVRTKSESLRLENRLLNNRLKKLTRKLKQGDYTLNDDDVKQMQEEQFEAEIELIREDFEESNRKLEQFLDKSESQYIDVMYDCLHVKENPRQYRMKLPGYERAQGRLGNSVRIQNVQKMQRDYQELYNKPREERQKQVQKLQIKRLENKVAKDVDKEIQYQKSRIAIEKIHKGLIKKRSTLNSNLDLSLDLNTPESSTGKYHTQNVSKSVKNSKKKNPVSAILQQDEEDSIRDKGGIGDVQIIQPLGAVYKTNLNHQLVNAKNSRSVSIPSKKIQKKKDNFSRISMESQPVDQYIPKNQYHSVGGAQKYQPPMNMPLIPQLNNYGRHSQISSSSNSGAMMLPQVKNSKYITNNSRDKMIARANNLQSEQDAYNEKAYSQAMKRQDRVIEKGLKSLGR